MERFAGHSFHSARWDYGYTGGGPGEPLTELGDQVVGVIGTGATSIQCVPPLADAAQHVYVFQRTPSAVGVRGNRPTDPGFAETLRPGWQQDRMDNFQAVMLGRPVDADLVDDGWTQHYAAVQNPPRHEGMSIGDYMRGAEEVDFGIMEEHRPRVDELVSDPDHRRDPQAPVPLHVQAAVLPRRVPRRLQPPERHARRLPGRHRADHRARPGDRRARSTRSTASSTPPASRPSSPRCTAGPATTSWAGTVTLAERWADGASSLFGMMVRGFPNLFVMPAPGQQAVVTVNYTQLAVFGAEVVGRLVGLLEAQGVRRVRGEAEAEEAWTQKIVDSFVDASHVLSACTPSRINMEGHPENANPATATTAGASATTSPTAS